MSDLSEQELVDMEVADSIGDFGCGDSITRMVDEIRRRRSARPAFPKHMYLRLEHNPHRVGYQPLERWLEDQFLSGEAGGVPRDETICPEDLAAIRATGEVWVLSWCLDTPVGSCEVIAATLERVLELAGEK